MITPEEALALILEEFQIPKDEAKVERLHDILMQVHMDGFARGKKTR